MTKTTNNSLRVLALMIAVAGALLLLLSATSGAWAKPDSPAKEQGGTQVESAQGSAPGRGVSARIARCTVLKRALGCVLVRLRQELGA